MRLRIIHANDPSDCFSHRTSATLGRLLEVLLALDVLREAFFFTELLEAAEHLIDGFAVPRFDPNGHKLWGPPQGGFEPRIRAETWPDGKRRGPVRWDS